MAVWSSLASKYNQNINITKNLYHFFRNGLKGKGMNVVPVRPHSHERTMPIRTSVYEHGQIKKFVTLYLLVGIIPLSLIVAYCNIFIGPAELALIPEGYEPKPWEYYKHPITRFFAKYITPSPQELHERSLHTVHVYNEIHQLRLLEKKVKGLIEKRRDYEAWFYEIPYVKYSRKAMEDSITRSEESGRAGKWLRR